MFQHDGRPALLFDLDGTLLDTLEDIAASVNAVRGSHGLPPWPAPRIAACIGDGLEQLLLRTLDAAAGPELTAALDAYSNHHAAHLADRTHPYPGVLDTLPRLDGRGHAMAIVSNKPARYCQRLVEHFGWQDCFSVVIGGDSAVRRKPDPAPVHMACEALGVEPGSAWMIGDSPGDVRAGQEAGCAKSIAVTWGYRDREALEAAQPDVVLESMTDLLAC